MSGTHLALVVDDDKYILEEVESMLNSMGHECRLALTQEEALALLEEQSFCYVVLDLEMKLNAKSAKAKIQTGFNILEHIRERNKDLPVIIMTAHGKGHELTVRAFKMGATDYIKKPFDQDAEPLEDKVRDALSKNCEARYPVCPNTSKERSVDVARRADYSTHKYQCYDRLHIPGTVPLKRSNDLVVNGHTIKMPDSPFRLLMELVVELKKGEGGWLTKVVDAGKYQKFGHLRTPLEGSLLEKDAEKLIENDRSKHYRISTHPDFVTYDRGNLMNHPEAVVRELAKKLP
jgi:DNA-binding response OmpR family regulator